MVAQAFHVAYWDSLGWVDRFASTAYTARQREVAAANGLSNIYTPQVLVNGHDWRNWGQSPIPNTTTKARAFIVLQRSGSADLFDAHITPASSVSNWTAYWAVTESGYGSHVKAGENAGEFLKHDFVVRQYLKGGRYQGPQVLTFAAIAAQPDHPRQVNLVVSDGPTGELLQAVSLQCL